MRIKISDKGRKGELTTTQLVTLIVLIVSFIIILLLIFRLNLGGTTDREICHNSVVLIDKASSFVGSLDCRTNYLCISGGDDCEGTSSEKVKVDSKNKKEIMKAIADEMANCWWQFGEGKVDYTKVTVFSNKACALCSTISFDKKVQESLSVLSYQDLYDYLSTTPKSSSQSYLQYIYTVKSLNSLEPSTFSPKGLDDLQQFYIPNYLGNNIYTGKEYFILTGESKAGHFWNIFDIKQIPITILENTKENYAAVGCDEFITKA